MVCKVKSLPVRKKKGKFVIEKDANVSIDLDTLNGRYADVLINGESGMVPLDFVIPDHLETLEEMDDVSRRLDELTKEPHVFFTDSTVGPIYYTREEFTNKNLIDCDFVMYGIEGLIDFKEVLKRALIGNIIKAGLISEGKTIYCLSQKSRDEYILVSENILGTNIIFETDQGRKPAITFFLNMALSESPN